MYRSHQLDQRSHAPHRRTYRAIWILGALGLLAPSCLIDPDDRCGPNQYLLKYAEESERCVCVDGFAFDATSASCVQCGENEMVSPTAGCVCVPTHSRATPADPCTPLPEGVTKPTGEDESCMTHDDCAGFEASFCDSFVTFTCLVPNCTLAPDNCFAGKECCDLSSFGLPTLCIADGACTTP